MIRLAPCAAMVLAVAACAPAPEPTPLPETSLPFADSGYRADGDLCRGLGESADTVEYLDHTADLVGCPEGMENLGVFVTETGAVEMTRQDGYILYSVPNE